MAGAYSLSLVQSEAAFLLSYFSFSRLKRFQMRSIVTPLELNLNITSSHFHLFFSSYTEETHGALFRVFVFALFTVSFIVEKKRHWNSSTALET